MENISNKRLTSWYRHVKSRRRERICALIAPLIPILLAAMPRWSPSEQGESEKQVKPD
jgi:hypothetical protein